MNKVNESTIKYLAGLLDADGSLTPVFQHNYYHLVLQVTQSCVVDKSKEIEKLYKEFGCGVYREYEPHRNNFSSEKIFYSWTIRDRSSLEQILPRVIKHSVIKARHFQNLLTKFREYKGTRLTDEQIQQEKDYCKESRRDPRPLKKRNHPTWAWLAGFMDGDGWYVNVKRKDCNSRTIRIGAATHFNDSYCLQLIQKNLGGSLRTKNNLTTWQLNLGFSKTSKMESILPKIVKHSRIKKYKIEQIIHTHRQRLTEKKATA